jgi:hypothetical protein
VWGEASVTVEVDVLLFSGSVTLGPVRKRFAGGSGSNAAAVKKSAKAVAQGKAKAAPPALPAAGTASFTDLLDPVHWDAYRALFAPAAFA